MTNLLFPSAVGGTTTHEVAYVHVRTPDLACWVSKSLGPEWKETLAAWTDISDAVEALSPSRVISRYAFVPVADWSVVLNNGPRGTDVGVLPSQAAREFRCLGIRAVAVDDGDGPFPARVLEVYSPAGAEPLGLVRAIAAANDGGRWVFESVGEPYEFEDRGAYRNREKARRLTTLMVHQYLNCLGVPTAVVPDWSQVRVVERSTAERRT